MLWIDEDTARAALLAFASGTHPKLGKNSPVSLLPPYVVQDIASFFRRRWAALVCSTSVPCEIGLWDITCDSNEAPTLIRWFTPADPNEADTLRAGQCSSWCGFISTREVFAGQGHWLSGFSFTGERTRSLPCFTRVVRAVDLQDNILAVGDDGGNVRVFRLDPFPCQSFKLLLHARHSRFSVSCAVCLLRGAKKVASGTREAIVVWSVPCDATELSIISSSDESKEIEAGNVAPFAQLSLSNWVLGIKRRDPFLFVAVGNSIAIYDEDSLQHLLSLQLNSSMLFWCVDVFRKANAIAVAGGNSQGECVVWELEDSADIASANAWRHPFHHKSMDRATVACVQFLNFHKIAFSTADRAFHITDTHSDSVDISFNLSQHTDWFHAISLIVFVIVK